MARKVTSKATGRGTAVQEMPHAKRAARMEGPSHQQIAQRAQEIWTRHGCPPGEDKENWFEAEAELRREMGLR
jgi:hypothetical protein